MNAVTTINRTLTETIESIEHTLSDTFDTITSTLSERADTLNTEISDRLERIENRIPELPKKVVAYQRVVAGRAFAQASRNNDLVVDAFRPVVKVADTGVRTVVGTTKWAVEQTAGTAATGVRTVIGQAKAQAKRTAVTLNTQTVDLVEEATDRVVAAERSIERAALKSMTKAELYQMAQDIDVEGRSDMTKAQLIKAINAAG
jgi:ABC-type Fe3+-hydroxamate transport system substrate-binding protein